MVFTFRVHTASGVLAAILTVLYLANFAHGKVLLAYYVHRYGARNILPKSALLSESNATGGPALLPIGRLQNHDAGREFRARYLQLSTCKKTDTCLSGVADQYGVFGRENVEYNNYNTLIRSSGLDRTVSAANAFAGGMFPNATDPALPDLYQAIPVYSLNDTQDWFIRAYTKCPAYNNKLEDWYSSSEFTKKEKESATLRQQVTALDLTMNTSLSNWWNVYDAFNTYQTYGYGNPLPSLPNTTFSQVVDLAYWLEAAKMRSEFTSNMLGGPLLNDLLGYMRAAVGANPNTVFYKLLGISGHYNVLMALPSALKLDQGSTAASYPWNERIPPFASVLVFEVHTDESGANPSVRAVYQEGPETDYKTMPLPCAKAGDAAEKQLGPGACTLSNFYRYADPLAISSAGEWCQACQNKDIDVCRLHWLESQGMVSMFGEKGSHGRGDETVTIVVSVVCSSVATAFLIVMGFTIFKKWGTFSRKRGKMLDLMDMPGMDASPAVPVSHIPMQHV